MFKVGDKAIWNSPKGYSLPDEVVIITTVGRGMYQIESPADPENMRAWYWVYAIELTPIK